MCFKGAVYWAAAGSVTVCSPHSPFCVLCFLNCARDRHGLGAQRGPVSVCWPCVEDRAPTGTRCPDTAPSSSTVFQELSQTSEHFNVCIMQYTLSFKPPCSFPSSGHCISASLPCALRLWICYSSNQQSLALLCFVFALETSGLTLMHAHRVQFSAAKPSFSLLQLYLLPGKLIQPALLGNPSLPPK